MHVARREVALDRVAGSATCVIRGGMAPRWTEQLERLGSGSSSELLVYYQELRAHVALQHIRSTSNTSNLRSSAYSVSSLQSVGRSEVGPAGCISAAMADGSSLKTKGCRIRPPTSRFVEIAEAAVPGSGFPLTNQRSLRHVDPNFDFRQLF